MIEVLINFSWLFLLIYLGLNLGYERNYLGVNPPSQRWKVIFHLKELHFAQKFLLIFHEIATIFHELCWQPVTIIHEFNEKLQKTHNTYFFLILKIKILSFLCLTAYQVSGKSFIKFYEVSHFFSHLSKIFIFQSTDCQRCLLISIMIFWILSVLSSCLLRCIPSTTLPSFVIRKGRGR